MNFSLTLSFIQPEHLCEIARTAEAYGWAGISVSDHLVHPMHIEARYPYNESGERMWTHETPWPDVWVSTAMMAAVTERLEFMQSVYVLPMRDPFHVAKAVGTLAIMSGHRVSLGIGLGWMSDEFRLLSVPFEKRARRMDEMVEVMRKLWTGGIVEHHGDFYDFAPLSMAPGVGREIPIIVGGVSEAAMRRTARLGAAWAPAYLDTEELRAGIAKIHEYRREYGSDDRPLRVYTSPTDVLEPDDFRRAEEAGVTDFFGTPWIDFEGEIDYTKLVRGVPLDMILDGIKRFADDVIAKIS